MKKTTNKTIVSVNRVFNTVADIPKGKIQINQIDTMKFSIYKTAVCSIASESYVLEKKLKNWKKAYATDLTALKKGNNTVKTDAELRDDIAHAEAMIDKFTKQSEATKRSIETGKNAVFNCITEELHAEYKKACADADNDYIVSLANHMVAMGLPATKKFVDYVNGKIGMTIKSDREIMKCNGKGLVKALPFKAYRELLARVLVDFVDEKCGLAENKVLFDAYNKDNAKPEKANK